MRSDAPNPRAGRGTSVVPRQAAHARVGGQVNVQPLSPPPSTKGPKGKAPMAAKSDKGKAPVDVKDKAKKLRKAELLKELEELMGGQDEGELSEAEDKLKQVKDAQEADQATREYMQRLAGMDLPANHPQAQLARQAKEAHPSSSAVFSRKQ
eukprot:8442387-Pyramimonas_sp.AAC.1